MKKFLSLLLLGFLFFSFTSATTTYLAKTENGHGYKVMKVVLDGKSKIVVSVVPSYTPAQSLKTLMQNVGGSSAINGGYFCPNEAAYSRCTANTSSVLRKSDGVLYSMRKKDIGMYKSLFGFNQNGEVTIVANNGSYQEDPDVDKVYNGIAMPTLVQDGINVAVLNDEMNNDPKQGRAGNKTFICSTEDNSTIYMGYVDGVTFSSLADYIITTFNCYNAIQLDNGGSKAMINKGNYVAGPGRNIMDAFVIVEGDGVGTKVTPTAPATGPTAEELQTAITWMYNQGLTMYDNIEQFLPNNTMTREEASKFFSVFAQKEYSKTEDSNKKCSFYDIKKADPTLRNNIVSSCRLGIFQGYKNNFTPLEKLNNAQAITVLMRIMVGMMNEPTQMYYANYLSKAKEFGLVSNIDVKAPIKRGDAAMMIYKAHLYKEKNTVADPFDILLQQQEETLTCSSNQHREGNSCISNTKTCYGSNGAGTQQWNGSSRGTCILNSCDAGYTMQNGSCIANTRSCTVTNGVGQQTRNGYSRGSCVLSSCNAGYMNVNNNCLAIKSRSCTISNGQGIQTGSYSVTNYGYYYSYTRVRGTCAVVSCNIGYMQSGSTCITNTPTCISEQHLENNICVANTMSCIIANGIGQQTRSGTLWGACTILSCNAGYTLSGAVCTIIVPTCTSEQHLENNICVANTGSCTIENGIGQQTWNGTAWNACSVVSCNTGYELSGSTCTIIPV